MNTNGMMLTSRFAAIECAYQSQNEPNYLAGRATAEEFVLMGVH